MADVLDFKLPDWYEEEDINMFHDATYSFYKNERAPHSDSIRKNKMDDRRI